MQQRFAATWSRLCRLVCRFAASIVVAGALLSGPTLAASSSDYFCYRFADYAHRVVVGPDGRIYVAGFTHTADLPAATSVPEPPAAISTDAYFIGFFFVSALASDGTPLWTSYLPGFGGSTSVRGLAVGTDGSVWLAGGGMSVPAGSGPTKFDASYIVLAKFAGDGRVVFAENVGGGDDGPTDLALTQDGDAIVVGATRSDDFPGAPSKGGYYADYGAGDAFVMRMHGDGSGPVWTRRFGGRAPSRPTRVDVGGVVVDTDGTIVVNFVAPRDAAHVPQGDGLAPPAGSGIDHTPVEERPTPMYVVRLDASGATKRAARLGFMGSPGKYAYGYPPFATLAFDRDRNVLVGGIRGAARIAPDLKSVVSVWTLPSWSPDSGCARFRVDVDDTVLVLRKGYDAIYALRDGEPPALADDPSHLYVSDLALDAAGDRVLLGNGEGTPFHVAFEHDVGPDQQRYTTWVAKYPRLGISGPRNLTLRPGGTDSIELLWEPGPDAVVRYDVEPNPGWWPTPPALLSVDGSASFARVEGLEPATGFAVIRLVAEFANGVRTSLYTTYPSPSGVGTYALPPTDVVVSDGPGLTVDVRWTDNNAGRVHYYVERRIGDGEWTAIHRGDVTDHLTDLVPDVGLPLFYRVRGNFPEPVEARPIIAAATLRLVPTQGRLTQDASHLGVFVESGRIQSEDPATPLAFDPAQHELRVLWGDVNSPRELRIQRGDTWWSESDGTYRWSSLFPSYGLRPGSEVVLDPVRGTFRIELRLQTHVLYGWDDSTWTGQFALNVAWGSFSGGSIDTWQHTLRRRESWNLR